MTIARVSKYGHGVLLVAAVVVASAISVASPTMAEPLAVEMDAGGDLVYQHDEQGNRIPDFSHCGYAGSDRDIPDVPAKVLVRPEDGDDGARIQAAINEVSELPLGDNGFRGAVELAPGTFEVEGQLHIRASGVVLRGAGVGDGGTVIVATGTDRRTLLRIEGEFDRRIIRDKPCTVTDDHVPVGSYELRLDSVTGLKVGIPILITRPSTIEWITTIGADAFGVAWKPGTRDIRWDRVITTIDGNTITLDAPITTAIEKRYGGATVKPYEWPGRISNVGVEELEFRSAYENERPDDEDHAWHAVSMQNVDNAWVRRVQFRYFAGGAVTLLENTKHITVTDCVSLEPVSELGGYRRHTFFTLGQLALFLRCWSENGRHDFAVGHCAAGPNAFVNCYARNARAESGPIESWASGVLYDNVRIDGASLDLKNRWISPSGAGWSAANCVLWQCQAATMHVARPPTANNWAIGVWAGFSGDGTFQARSDFVRPISLYHGQLRQRRGDAAAAHVTAGLIDPIGSTNPTISEAARFSEQSKRPAVQLIDVIREQWRIAEKDSAERNRSTQYGVPSTNADAHATTATTNPDDAAYPTPDTGSKIRRGDQLTAKPLRVQNGWLTIAGRLVTGGLQQQGFWRGSIRPDEAPSFGPGITRFVPGRVGTGFTDDLQDVAAGMLKSRIAVFDHHYGLWYDRRRDDHTMVRQKNGDVAPPFYEQPFARTGRGKAWDGLSSYDLTKFNPWYWRRLRDFAALCDESGLVLFHQNYFQHNILEAGAHWADSPWRPANNINDTGLPEPPPYIGDKRIFMASQFYDVTDPRRRELHRSYIRQCLDNFAGRSNVIQMTSAEYSGPLEFTQFWLDTIVEWQRETERDALVAISAPKDVQDAILADPERSPHVDIIDIRYWAYTAGDELYAPKGGQNLAPRQHLRQTRQKPGGFAAIVKTVNEYRRRYPEKAVTYYADMHCPSTRDGWAVLMGGGSLPNVIMPNELAAIMPTLRPTDDVVTAKDQWCLGNDGDDYLIYTENIGEIIQVRLPGEPSEFRVRWIDRSAGDVKTGATIDAAEARIKARTNVLWLQRIDRRE